MEKKTKIEELTIEGITYIPKGSEKITPEYTGEVKIVVLQRGWVYIGRLEKVGNQCKLHNAFNIRIWGTTKGLGELVEGPTTTTQLDECKGIVEFDWLTVIHTITVNESKWKQV